MSQLPPEAARLSFMARLSDAIKTYGSPWVIGGEHKYPEYGDVAKLVDRLERELLDSNGAWIECGQLLLRKDGDYIDIFFRMGEL